MPASETLHWKRNLVLMWLSSLLVLSGFAAVMPFIPLFLRDQLGIIAEGERGIYMSMFYFFGVLGYAVFCPIWGMLADRFGVRPLLLRGTFVTAFIFPLMGYVTSAWMLIALRFLSGATPKRKRGSVFGWASTAQNFGIMLSIVFAGWVIFAFGMRCVFSATAILTLIFLPAALWIVNRTMKQPYYLAHACRNN